MNSSGIKRGLATTAVSALAIAGLPLFASSASAATGDSIAVSSVGPVRNDGSLGGVIVLKTKGINENNLRLAATDLVSKANTPSQTVEIVSASLAAEGTANDSNKTDGFDEITVNVKVSTPAAGDNFAFAIYEDEDGDDTVDTDPALAGIQGDADAFSDLPKTGAQAPDVDATEARTTVTGSTAGAPASIVISPDSQTTSAGVPTGDYTATIRDASNNLTQLTGTEGFALTGTGVSFTPDGTLSAAELVSGQTKFKASSSTAGETTFTAKGNGNGATPATLMDSAVINVIANATITPDEFDLVTGADTYETGDAFGSTYKVRVDQGSITFNFASLDKDATAGPDDANKAVVLTLSGTGVTFAGEATRTYTVVLDSAGKGSLTVTPEAISDGDSFTFAATDAGINATTVQFERAAATPSSVKTDQSVYVTKIGSNTAVTVTVVDQFGNPVGAPTQVSILRGLRNGATETARQTVGADGKATFILPDAGTVAGTEAINVNYYDDQFDGSATSPAGNEAVINYTADGLGGDFSLSDVSTGSIVPLTDGEATNPATEYKTVAISGGTANATVNVSVDNGAVILVDAADDTLPEGSSSEAITLDALGAGSFKVVGTKTGLVTVTVTSAGRTKTETLTVKQDPATVIATARNIELEGPEAVTAGDVFTYTATVTDAFGNPVPGFGSTNAGFAFFQVSGPASLQNGESVSDANGEIEQPVLLTDGADGSITVKVTGTGAQFGSRASEETAAAGLNTAPGFTASQDTDSVTSDVTNIKALEQAVADAQAALAAAQADLAEAQGNLDIANTELAVAQANVDTLTAKKAELRQKLNKAKANDNRRKAKTLRQKLRAVKRNLNAAQDDLTIAAAKAAVAQGVVDRRQAQVDAAEEALAQAQADLDAAQG